MSRDCSIVPLFVDEKGILCAGGRLRRSHLDNNCKNPVLLPKVERVLLIIEWCHFQYAHGGRGLTFNELNGSGYWEWQTVMLQWEKQYSNVFSASDPVERRLNKRGQDSQLTGYLKFHHSHTVG